jgi:simple sugar transport system ATP-binding protein
VQELTADAAIELRQIDKSFGSVHAVRGASLRVERGSITGIVGENGAGKSTLMSILYGLYRADAGEILIDGRPVEMAGPRDAIGHGIGMVHQHFMLVDSFTVLENLILGAEGGALLADGLATARAELARLAGEYGLAVDPDARIADLSVGEQQRVEILKVLVRGARILILDEPSAVLTPQETDRLLEILRLLRDRGVTVVLITHKLREILAVTDKVIVMRRGEVVAERRTAETGAEELAELMVGRKVRLDLDKAPARTGETMLAARHLSLVDGRGVRLLDDISLEVKAGGRSWASPAFPAMARPNCCRSCPASGCRPAARWKSVAARSMRPTRSTRPKCARSASPMSRKTGCGRDLCRPSSLRKPRSSAIRIANPSATTTSWTGPPSANTAPTSWNASTCGRARRAFARRTSPAATSRSSILAREMARNPGGAAHGPADARRVDIGAIEFIRREHGPRCRDAGQARCWSCRSSWTKSSALADRILVMFGGRIVGEGRTRARQTKRTNWA